jgi:hypothetical protein
MPPRVRGVPELESFELDERVALALRPDLERDDIPVRQTLASGDPPYAGETREAQGTVLRAPLAPGASVTLATLRRAWEVVGFIVNPGNAAAPGLTAQLRVLGRSVQGLTAPVVVAPGQALAFVGILVGSRCELVVINASASPVTGIAGEIWGMAQR